MYILPGRDNQGSHTQQLQVANAKAASNNAAVHHVHSTQKRMMTEG